MKKEALAELLSKELIIGHVYGYNGEQQCFYFENSSSNIANFIMLHQENASEIVLTDMLDRMVLNTFGEFINRCPDQNLLQEILKDLIPMQMGEKNRSLFPLPQIRKHRHFGTRKKGMSWRPSFVFCSVFYQNKLNTKSGRQDESILPPAYFTGNMNGEVFKWMR